jgi:hypothetical protein
MSLNADVELLRQWFYFDQFVTFFRYFIAVLSHGASSVESAAPLFAGTPFRMLLFTLRASAIKDFAPSSEICNDPRPYRLCFNVCIGLVCHSFHSQLNLPDDRSTIIRQGKRFKQSVRHGVMTLFIA